MVQVDFEASRQQLFGLVYDEQNQSQFSWTRGVVMHVTWVRGSKPCFYFNRQADQGMWALGLHHSLRNTRVGCVPALGGDLGSCGSEHVTCIGH